MEKLIITAAICGAEVTKEKNPAVPYTIEEVAREARLAHEAGAAIIHLHVRHDDGTPTQEAARFRQAMEAIAARCPRVIIQPSTGGAVGMSNDERLQPLTLRPEMATLDCGTVNFGGDDIFVNTESTIKEFAARMRAIGTKPEIEVFDKGMIDCAVRLHRQGHIPGPLHFNFVMGTPCAIGADARDLVYLAGSVPPGSTWTASGIGRHQFPVATMALAMGGHVRVGFEDNVFMARGVPARSNGEMVERVVRIARELGREIASPDQARTMLHLPPAERMAEP